MNTTKVIQQYAHDREVSASYSIPFEFQLPEVPGCFSEGGLGGSGQLLQFEATISYTISAICTPLRGLGKPVSCSDPFYVEERLKQDVIQRKMRNTFTIYTFFCISRGKCHISVTAKNAVFPGENAQKAICDISNQSTVDVKDIELSIKKNFKVRAQGHEHTYSKVVAMTKHRGGPGILDFIHKRWSRKLSFDVPVNLTPTTNSTLIQCTYRMEVKLVMNTCECGSNVVGMPLTVYPASQLEVAPQPPVARGKDLHQGLINAMLKLAELSSSESNRNKRPFIEMEQGHSDPSNTNPRPPKRQRKENSSPPR